MCGCALSVMLLTLAVVLPTPHDSSGALQGGYRARFHSQPQGGLLREQEGLCILYSIEHTHTHGRTHAHVHIRPHTQTKVRERLYHCMVHVCSCTVHTYICVGQNAWY